MSTDGFALDQDDGSDVEQRRDLPHDPAKVFKFATYDIDFIAGEMESGPNGSIGAVNRMLLVQYFSAIEAYLSDTLIRLVLDEPKAMSALVRGNKEWVGERIGVTELASNPDAFANWVHTRLRELMYHNFSKIDHYYRGAIGASIFPDAETKTTLMKFGPLRHDCVHRYGRDHDGREHQISKLDLNTLGDALETMVGHIEASIAQWRTRV